MLLNAMRNETVKAKEILEKGGHSCVFVSEKETLISDERGVKPLLGLLSDKKDMSSFSAADKIVGRAAAFLYVLLGVKEVYAEVLSKKAKPVFERYGITVFSGTETDEIINRDKTGICPMEKAVENTENPEEARRKIEETLEKLIKNAENG